MHLPKKKVEFEILNYAEAEKPSLANGLNFGQYVLLYDGRGDNYNKNSVGKQREYRNVLLSKAKVVPNKNGLVLKVEGKGRIFSAFIVDEENMCYTVPYLAETRKLTQEGEEVKKIQRAVHFDAHMREIKDVEFYKNLVNLYKDLMEEEKSLNKEIISSGEIDDLRDRDFLFELADRFSNSQNPFKRNSVLTKEQRDEVANFVEAVARKAYTNENYELEDEYYELMGLMENNLNADKVIK